MVDRQVKRLTPVALGEQQAAVGDRHFGVRWNQIDRVWLDFHLIGDTLNLQFGFPRKKFSHVAFKIRREMLHDDVRSAGVTGHITEELLDRFETTSRRADPDDMKVAGFQTTFLDTW